MRRVLIDTDVGLDVDDAYALAFAARSPELAVEGVTTVYGDTLLRAKIACKVLRLAGRGDIPVVAGLGKPLSR
ncbi:MAG: nucleoside hydrolase, partial [Candidatus Jordarchaeales archaeon]